VHKDVGMREKAMAESDNPHRPFAVVRPARANSPEPDARVQPSSYGHRDGEGDYFRARISHLPEEFAVRDVMIC